MSVKVYFGNGPGAQAFALLELDTAPGVLKAGRTTAGFKLALPGKMTIPKMPKIGPVMVRDLRCSILVAGSDGRQVEVGVARDESVYVHADGVRERKLSLVWRGTFADLAFVEQCRQGKDVTLQLEFDAYACDVFDAPQERHLMETVGVEIASSAVLTYSRDLWTAMLRSLGVSQAFVTEIPLPKSPGGQWEEIWKFVREATEGLERGGESGWKQCVVAVREALSRWQALEPEQHGPGWKAPGRDEREARSKKERLDSLRWHLLQCAHLGPHTPAEVWTREDAVLVLSGLAALLAARNP